jgi:hypothetical protein
MPLTTDIVRTWRTPRRVIRDILDQGRREDRAIAFLLIACFLIFIAQWPRLSRVAAGFDLPAREDAPELTQLMAYEFMGWVMIWPLLFYVIAAISHLIAKLMGGKGDWYGARIALFWSLLATVPLLLLHGLTAGFLGPGAQTNLVGAIWVIAFGVIWGQSLREAESKA